MSLIRFGVREKKQKTSILADLWALAKLAWEFTFKRETRDKILGN